MLAAVACFLASQYRLLLGRVFVAETGTYLIEKNGDATALSETSENKDILPSLTTGDLILALCERTGNFSSSCDGVFHLFKLCEGEQNDLPFSPDTGKNSGEKDPVSYDSFSPKTFRAQYIRTDGSAENDLYPSFQVIRSVKELEDYYKQNRLLYDLERREDPASDSTVGFLDACDAYDESYFQDQILLLVLLEEGSGSIRHEVKKVGLKNGKMVLEIETHRPEIGTCDMANWHIFIEPEKGTKVESEQDITLLLDGIDPKTQPTTLRHTRGFANLSLLLPKTWESRVQEETGSFSFSVDIWPKGAKSGTIRIQYQDFLFGVCGTGLAQQRVTLAGYLAEKGTYDGRKVWDYICFSDTPGTYVILNSGADVWWDEYGEEAMEILSTLKVGEGSISPSQATQIAKQSVTLGYDRTRTEFDGETGTYTVIFSKKNNDVENTEIEMVRITNEGKIIEHAISDPKAEKDRFRARILELYSGSVLVEPLEGEAIRSSCDKISFGTLKLDDIGVEVGDLVEIGFDGNVMESYPAQIFASSWRKIDQDPS